MVLEHCSTWGLCPPEFEAPPRPKGPTFFLSASNCANSILVSSHHHPLISHLPSPTFISTRSNSPIQPFHAGPDAT